MCVAATCDKCGKTTWKGCGKHVESVMSKVPKEAQCACARDDAAAAPKAPNTAATAAGEASGAAAGGGGGGQ